MTEDELLSGITDALTLSGWTWTHILRSDGVTMGHAGLPDVLAGKGGIVLAWELKTETGTPSHDQLRWLLALGGHPINLDARIIRPSMYDAALRVILEGVAPAYAFAGGILPASAHDVTADRRSKPRMEHAG